MFEIQKTVNEGAVLPALSFTSKVDVHIMFLSGLKLFQEHKKFMGINKKAENTKVGEI